MKMVNTLKRLISIFAIFATSLPVLSYSATQSSYPTKGIPVAGDKALITDSADGNKTKQATVGSFPISTATQTALDGKETKAVVQASAPADTTVDWYDTDQESGVLVLKRHNGTTWVRASSHGVQYLSSCSGIIAGMCVDTDDGKLYYHNNTSVVEVGTSGGSYTLPTASSDTLGGIKVGSRLTVTDGVLSADVQTPDLSGYATNSSVLTKTNTTSFTPTGDYHPATKKYVDDSITAGGGYTDEQAQDAAGSMFSGNTETGITVTYDDSTGKVNFAVATQSDVNFTSALNTKLTGIATGAEVNVNADWNASSGDSQILNKPTIPVIPTGTENQIPVYNSSGALAATTPLIPVDTSSIDVATSGDNVTFSVIPTYIQRRVSGACTAGSAIREIAEDGTVTCETDDNSGGSGGGVFETLSAAPYSDVACTSNGIYSHTAYFCVDGYYTEQATTTAYSNPAQSTYTLTIDGTDWDGTDSVTVGGSTYTADGTKSGLSGSTSVSVTPNTNRTAAVSGACISGSSSPYTATMSSDCTMSVTFSTISSGNYDTFTGADDTLLTAHNSEWVTLPGTTFIASNLEIRNNAITTTSGYVSGGAFYNSSSSDISQIVFKGQSTVENSTKRVAVRAGSDTLGYAGDIYAISSGDWTRSTIYKNGVQIGSDCTGLSIPIASDHTARIEASGTSTVTVTLYIDDVQVCQRSDTSSTIVSGHPGFYMSGTGTVSNNAVDSWQDY